MTLSDVLSIVAIVVSLSSVAVSAHVAVRDRARLKIGSTFITASEYGPDRIVATMVNAGRRPVILRMVGGTDEDGEWAGEMLDHDKGGIRLGEHERYEHTFLKEDTVGDFPGHSDLLWFKVLWVEDSLGVRHEIPNSREFIGRLW